MSPLSTLLTFMLACIIHTTQSDYWRRVLKLNRDVSVVGQTPAEWYLDRTKSTYADMTSEQTFITSPSGSSLTIDTNFKSLLIKEWEDQNIIVHKVRLSFCSGGTCPKQIVFDASNSVYNNWLQVAKIETSPWDDLTSTTSINCCNNNYEGLVITWPERNFAIWRTDGGCSADYIWFVVTVWTNSGCNPQWNEGQYNPNIIYSGTNTAVVTTDTVAAVRGETFIMEILIDQPTTEPTSNPTVNPTNIPTYIPTVMPTNIPTTEPTFEPTNIPSAEPTYEPTINPSEVPTFHPTNIPTVLPSDTPTHIPSINPTMYPSFDPTYKPTPVDGAAQERTTGIGNTDDGGKNIENQPYIFEGMIFILLLVVGALLCIVCILLVVCCGARRKQNINKETASNMHNALSEQTEMAQIVSTTNGEMQHTITTNDTYEDETLRDWLNDINLVQYYEIFKQHGYDVTNLKGFSDNMLEDIGINKMGHRKAILLKIENTNVDEMYETNQTDTYNGVDNGTHETLRTPNNEPGTDENDSSEHDMNAEMHNETDEESDDGLYTSNKETTKR